MAKKNKYGNATPGGTKHRYPRGAIDQKHIDWMRSGKPPGGSVTIVRAKKKGN